uniref:Tc1-like transposase DDE domain-containing protein n=1 Tax=Anolis carolinensis TaxID=28377 RepID=A0A803STN5_ANOCA
MSMKGVLLVDFLERGTTINSERYCQTLQNLRRTIQNKRRGKLRMKILLFHDNARPHTANRTHEVLESFKWELFPHPPYSPDLAPSDYHLFPTMKKWLATQHFDDDLQLQEEVTNWLKMQSGKFYEEGIAKLINRYQKCLILNGDYVEK